MINFTCSPGRNDFRDAMHSAACHVKNCPKSAYNFTPVVTVLQFSDWPCHMNRTLTTIIRLHELQLRTTHNHTSTQL